MQEQALRIEAADQSPIPVTQWSPAADTPVHGIIQISHGMAEHRLRYRGLADWMTRHGYIVLASDHRGHGEHLTEGAVPGHYADQDGWNKVVDDIYRVNRDAATRHPGLPIILLGHSMGSFIARAYILKHADTLRACIISATGMRYGGIAKLARGIARWDARRIGANRPSKLMATLSFGSFNLQFFPARTPFDWLSRDPAVVGAYMADPLCGQDCSAQLWADLFGGIIDFEAAEAAGTALPRRLPVLLLAGTRDPVSMGGLGIRQLAKRYRAAGMLDIETRLYQGGRHEMFNEINREEVCLEVVSWLNRHMRLAPAPAVRAGEGLTEPAQVSI